MRYLAARYGSGTLWPEDPAVRAIADQWMDWQHTTLGADLTYVFWAKVRNSPAHADLDKQAASIEKLGELWAMVDARRVSPPRGRARAPRA